MLYLSAIHYQAIYFKKTILVIRTVQGINIMNRTVKIAAALFSLVLPCSLYATDHLYCPQKHGYINLGMTTDQVKAACGEPVAIQESKRPYMEKIPVQQLMYTNKGTQTAVHSPFTVNVGFGGANLEVNIVNNKVKSILVNGNSANAASFCEGVSIQVGDDAAKVYGSCGTPTIVNNTFIEEPVRTVTKPIIWIYQPGENQPSVTLTFIDGKLQSIN